MAPLAYSALFNLVLPLTLLVVLAIVSALYGGRDEGER